MGYSIATLNNIRANASDEYRQRIPEATQQNIATIGQAFQTYTNVYNEFIDTLLNKIGKTIIEQKLFKNKLARFKSGAITNAQDVEEIFVEMAKAEGSYNPAGPNPLGRRNPPDVKVIYHRMNRRDYYCVSVGDVDFVRVFRSEATLDAFISGIINSIYSGAEYDEWCAMKNLLATYKNYFEYEVPAIRADNAADAAKTFVKTLRKAVQDLSFASTQYNAAGVKTWSNPADLVLLVNKDVVAEIDVEVLAKAFNMGKTDVQVSVVVMDDFGALDNTYALLVDKNFFRVYDTLSHFEPQRNAQGLFTNYFYHVHQILSASTFKNAVRFTPTEGIEGAVIFDDTIIVDNSQMATAVMLPTEGRYYNLYLNDKYMGKAKCIVTVFENEISGLAIAWDGVEWNEVDEIFSFAADIPEGTYRIRVTEV